MPRDKLSRVNLTSEQRERYLFLLERGVKASLASQLVRREDIISDRDSWLRRLWLSLVASLPWFPKLGQSDSCKSNAGILGGSTHVKS